jgi:hypothetical protein
MNATSLNELEQRFNDDGTNRAPPDPAHQATSCSPAEFQTIAAATRQEFLVRLDRWRNEDQRIKRR